MATNRWKKILSLILAATTVAVAVPTISSYADNEDTEETVVDAVEDTEASDAEAEDNAEDVAEATETVDESEWITMEDYTLVASNDTYNLYLYEPYMSVIVENKETGATLESTLSDANDDGTNNASWLGYMKSGIVLSAIIGTNSSNQVDLLNNTNTITYTYTDNGFSAKIDYSDMGFGLTVNVSLEEDGLVANIPSDSIYENKDGYYIGSVILFPMMGYSYLDDKEGYMLIPDGNGALIYLDDKEGRYSSGYSQMIYGSDDGFFQSDTTEYLWEKYDIVTDANEIIAPIYGIAHTDDQMGFLAVVEDGAERCTIEANPNGVMVNYNRAYAKFLLRDSYIQPLNQSSSGTVQKTEANRTEMDMTVRFLLVTGDEADYTGMAKAYRNYLLDNDLVTVQDTSYNTRVDFLGTDREEFLMGTRAVTMTTVDNIEEMYAELQEAGIESLLTIYKGWQKGGIYNTPITSYKADSHIGGTSSLTSLIKDAASDNYMIYLYNDALMVNASTNSTTFNVVKMVNKRTLEIETYDEVYQLFYYLMPTKCDDTLSDFVKSYTKKGVNTLCLAGITDTLYSYSSKGSFYTRVDTAESYESTIASIDESTSLILEHPAAYLWKYTEAFLDMPLSSSEYMYVDEDVPFLSIVLKGILPMYSEYVNFEANKTEFFLQMVESGVYPSFYLTYENSAALIYTNSADLYSTQYSAYKDTIIEYDEALRAIAELVDGATIEDHEKLESGVTKVTYSNGVVIYVNYTEEDVTVDGITVGAESYEVGETNE